MGIPTVFQTPVKVPSHCPNGRQLPALRAVQGDCERVYDAPSEGLHGTQHSFLINKSTSGQSAESE